MDDWGQIGSIALQVATGVGLAAAAGLRAFLPLLVVGIAGRMDWIPLSDSFGWLASDSALVVFGVAVVTELLADKIPVVDNFLDSVQFLVKPVAGAVLVASVATDLSPVASGVTGLLLGGTAAGGVHLVKAKLRLLSTLTSAGLGNPVLSILEDVAASLGAVLALLLPLLVLLGLAIMAVAVWYLLRGGRAPATQQSR